MLIATNSQYSNFLDKIKLSYSRLNFAKFNTKASEFYLLVNTTQILDIAVR